MHFNLFLSVSIHYSSSAVYLRGNFTSSPCLWPLRELEALNNNSRSKAAVEKSFITRRLRKAPRSTTVLIHLPPQLPREEIFRFFFLRRRCEDKDLSSPSFKNAYAEGRDPSFGRLNGVQRFIICPSIPLLPFRFCVSSCPALHPSNPLGKGKVTMGQK